MGAPAPGTPMLPTPLTYWRPAFFSTGHGVHGVGSVQQFPYARFPCANLSDLLYEPIWEAARHVENCGLEVKTQITCVYVYVVYCILYAYLCTLQLLHRLLEQLWTATQSTDASSNSIVYKIKNPLAKSVTCSSLTCLTWLRRSGIACLLSKCCNLWVCAWCYHPRLLIIWICDSFPGVTSESCMKTTWLLEWEPGWSPS